MKKFINKLLNPERITRYINISRNIRFLRTKFSLYDFTTVLIDIVKNNDLLIIGSGIAFSFTMSIFPGILFLFTLIPYMPVQDMHQHILVFLSEFMPHGIYDAAEDTIIDIISKPNKGLLSFGFLFALYSAMNGTRMMIRGFNRIYKTEEKRGFFRTNAAAFTITFSLSLMMLLSIVVIIVGRVIVSLLVDFGFIPDDFTVHLISVLKYFVLFLMTYLSIAFIYYMGPSLKQRMPFISVGSIIATILIIISSTGFSIYIDNFSNYNKLYGSIGTLIAVMLWLYLISLIIVVGFAINACLDTLRHNPRK